MGRDPCDTAGFERIFDISARLSGFENLMRKILNAACKAEGETCETAVKLHFEHFDDWNGRKIQI